MLTPAAAAAARMDSATRVRSATGKPSSRMKPADRYSGVAPATDRSLTVPLTARSPMSPPGKNSGDTTYESVVRATRDPARLSSAESSSGSRSGLANARRKIASTSVRVALPPDPWDMVIRSSLTRGARRRARSMRSSTCCSRSVTGSSRRPAGSTFGVVMACPPGLPRLPGRGASGRSCSTRRTPLPATPCRCRSVFPVCTRYRRPCTPTV